MDQEELTALLQNKVNRISKVFTEQIANLTVSLSEALERAEYWEARALKAEGVKDDAAVTSDSA